MTKYLIDSEHVDSMISYSEDAALVQAIERLVSEDGTISLPARNEVCPRCHGNGAHDHPAFANGFSRDDDFVDDDFIRDYQAGMFDVTCSVCHGARVVPVVSEASLNADQRRVWDEEKDCLRSLAQMRAEMRAERAYGA